jgi:hypothetical protein
VAVGVAVVGVVGVSTRVAEGVAVGVIGVSTRVAEGVAVGVAVGDLKTSYSSLNDKVVDDSSSVSVIFAELADAADPNGDGGGDIAGDTTIAPWSESQLQTVVEKFTEKFVFAPTSSSMSTIVHPIFAITRRRKRGFLIPFPTQELHKRWLVLVRACRPEKQSFRLGVRQWLQRIDHVISHDVACSKSRYKNGATSHFFLA